MPIGDLLAEISGGKGEPLPSSKTTASSSGTKRKVDDNPGSGGNKIAKARHSEGGSASHITSRPVDNATPGKPLRKPSPTRKATPPVSAGRSSQTTSASTSRATPNGKSAPTGYSGTAGHKRPSEVANRPKPSYSAVASSKPTASRPSSVAPPKKGSFQEIMARGAKAQQSMGKVGVIQHKAIDKPMTKKDREAVKTEQKAGAKTKPGKLGYTGSGRPGAPSSRDGPRSAAPKDAKTGGAKGRPGSSGEDQEKKVKKSATATTGYSGTARPRPGASKNKSGGASRGNSRLQRPRAGGLLAPPRTGVRDQYEDGYDEDMDDFIDYDDEEDDLDPRGAPRYNYASDASSDMEAGMSDIDGEERRAEKFARDEDKREQMLEEKLKREKEERKRRLARGY